MPSTAPPAHHELKRIGVRQTRQPGLRGARIELQSANYHSDEGDAIVYMPKARFLMAIDTLAPGYAPFMGFDITSDFHEDLNVFMW